MHQIPYSDTYFKLQTIKLFISVCLYICEYGANGLWGCLSTTTSRNLYRNEQSYEINSATKYDTQAIQVKWNCLAQQFWIANGYKAFVSKVKYRATHHLNALPIIFYWFNAPFISSDRKSKHQIKGNRIGGGGVGALCAGVGDSGRQCSGDKPLQGKRTMLNQSFNCFLSVNCVGWLSATFKHSAQSFRFATIHTHRAPYLRTDNHILDSNEMFGIELFNAHFGLSFTVKATR